MGFSVEAASKAAAYLGAFYSDPAFEPDPKAASEPDFDSHLRPPIDGALVWFRRAHRELRTRFAKIAFQRSSRSDVTPSTFDRYPILRELAGVARAVINSSTHQDGLRLR